jgi:hypothetical protein
MSVLAKAASPLADISTLHTTLSTAGTVNAEGYLGTMLSRGVGCSAAAARALKHATRALP